MPSASIIASPASTLTAIPSPRGYLHIAEYLSNSSHCLNKRWGCVIVNTKGDVVSGAYNDPPKGRITCDKIGNCYRVTHNIPRGTRYETCRSIHSEVSAIIAAKPEDLRDATLYLYGYDVVKKHMVENPSSCTMCRRAIIDAGIKTVIVADSFNIKGYRTIPVSEWIDNDETLTDNVAY